MHLTPFGPGNEQPTIAVIGVFDPFIHLHAAMMRELAETAHRTGRTSLAILLAPDPRELLHGAERWPVFDDAATRRDLIRAAGVERILQLACTPDDLDAGAREVFDLVCKTVHLEELWLGARQRLGSGPVGSEETVLREASRHRIRIMRLPAVEILPFMDQARSLLFQGRVAAAASHLGRAPQRRRSDSIKVAWAPGTYTVQALDDRGNTVLLDLTVERQPSGLSVAPWPDPRFIQITILEGPGDLPARMPATAAD